MAKFGQIILLNGASSSGKTSILRALQMQLNEPYLDAGIDRFLWMMPKRYLDRPLWDEVLGLADRAGDYGHRLVKGMHRAIAALSGAGLNVVADHVLVEPSWVTDLAEVFAPLPVLFVGVRCPLKVLEERERARKDRTLGQARLQHKRVHAYGVYDFEVDSALCTPQECAQQIVARLETGGIHTGINKAKDPIPGVFSSGDGGN